MVMYRDFATRTARKLNLAGNVRNNKDGSVSIIAEGEEVSLREFVAHLHKGSLLAHVEHVTVRWGDATAEFTDFVISYE